MFNHDTLFQNGYKELQFSFQGLAPGNISNKEQSFELAWMQPGKKHN